MRDITIHHARVRKVWTAEDAKRITTAITNWYPWVWAFFFGIYHGVCVSFDQAASGTIFLVIMLVSVPFALRWMCRTWKQIRRNDPEAAFWDIFWNFGAMMVFCNFVVGGFGDLIGKSIIGISHWF